jgi:hypothetical protein
VTQPTLEPNILQTDLEIYDSINTYCKHEFTGHSWFYDLQLYINNATGQKNWINLTSNPIYNEISSYDLYNYADFDDNVTLRCRTYNEYFGYSNYSYQYNIIKKSLNDVKLYRPFLSTIFLGQLTEFYTICDMANNNKYSILYHYVDINGDGTYDKLSGFNQSLNMNYSSFVFDTQFEISGDNSIAVGCIIKKNNVGETWDFSYCNEAQTECTIQNSYVVNVI